MKQKKLKKIFGYGCMGFWRYYCWEGYIKLGDNTCQVCPAGTYTDVCDGAECKKCENGKVCRKAASTSAEKCPFSTFAAATRDFCINCVFAPEGKVCKDQELVALQEGQYYPTQKLSKENIFKLAKYAGRIYDDEPTAQTKNFQFIYTGCMTELKAGYGRIGPIQSISKQGSSQQGSTQAKNSLIVVFRGTVPWKFANDIVDLVFAPVTLEATTFGACEACEVHLGFQAAYQAIRDELWRAYEAQSAEKAVESVVFTGHSLGGALATLAAFDFSNSGKAIKVQLVTFGSPRVGNRQFALKLNAMLKDAFNVRVTNQNDPVTEAPPAKLGLGFFHVGSEYMITSDLQEFEDFPVNYDRPKKLLNNPAYHSKYQEWKPSELKLVTANDGSSAIVQDLKVKLEI